MTRTAIKSRSTKLALIAGTAAIALAATAAGAAPIDTVQPFYLQSQVGVTVTPTFAGGTLRDDQINATDGSAYSVGAFSTNTIDAFGHTTTFGGVFSGTGPLTITDSVGGGGVVLTGLNTYTGTTTINSGAKLAFSGVNSNSIASSAGVVDNGTLDVTGMASNLSIKTLSGNGSVIVGPHGVQLTNAADTFSGVISGTSGFLVNGGTETLTGTNTYTGGTIVNFGAHLVLTGSGSIANSAGVQDSGTFDISGTTSGAVIKALSGPGSVALGSKTLTLIGAFNAFSGVISGSGGGLTVSSGTQTLTGINTYTGTTTISAGATLALTGATGTLITTSASVADFGTLDLTGNTAIVPITSLSGNGSVLTGPQGLQLLNAGDTFSGVISGPGALFVHAGTETLTGTNTYTNRTVIGSGATLALSGSGSMSASRTVTIDGTFDISGLTNGGTSVAGIGDAGSVVLGANTLTLTNAVTVSPFGGVISGAGGLTIAGGPQILSGANTYRGLTTINAGASLQVGAFGTSGSIAGNVLDNGALTYARSNTLTSAGVISGSGTLTQTGNGTLILNGVNSITGLTTISNATLEVGDAAHPGAVLDSHIGGVTVGAGGALEGHGTINGAVRNLSGGVVAPGGSVGTLTVGSYSQSASSTLAIEVTPSAASQLNVLGAASLNGTLYLSYDAGTYAPAIYKILAAAPVTGTFSTVDQGGLPSNMVQGVYYKPGATEVDLVVEPASSAQGFAALSTVTLDEAQSLAGIVSDRVDTAGCATGPKTACDAAAVWGQVLVRTDHTHRSGEIAVADENSNGLIAGLDAPLASGAVGVAVAYSQNTLSLDSATTRATGHSVFASAYGRVSAGGFDFDAQAFYLGSTWTQSRTVGAYGVASSKPNGTTGGGVLQVAYPMMDGKVKPYLKVSYADFQRDAVTETTTQVGPLALAVASGSNSSTRAEAGIKFATTFTNADGVIMSPELRLGLSQDLSSNNRDVQARLALVPTTTFVSSGVKPDQTSGVVAGALRVKLSDRLDIYGDLRARVSANQSEGAASLGGRYRF